MAKIEEVLGQVTAARERLAKVPAILKRFRQSVLAAACSGRLTEDWRVKQPNLEISSDARSACDPPKEDDWSTPLPPFWLVGPAVAVASEVVDCPHSTPKWTEKGKICLRTTNFQPGRLDLSETRFVSEETFRQRTSRIAPKSGDIVYSREGGILGIACEIPDGAQVCLGQRMMLMRVRRWMVPTFLMHVLNSPTTLDVVKELTGGTASPHLNVADVKAFRIPVPSFAEQREIVRRVELLFARADEIERRVTAATQRVERVTQAVLAKAFRGELVPTEAELARREGCDYEPASVLLERIRVERSEPMLRPGYRGRRAR